MQLTSYARYLAFAPSFDRLQQNPEDSTISQLIVTIIDSARIAASLAGGGENAVYIWDGKLGKKLRGQREADS